VKKLLSRDRWKDISNRAIAEAVRVSDMLVATIKSEIQELEPEGH
jgi:hypothetical protein